MIRSSLRSLGQGRRGRIAPVVLLTAACTALVAPRADADPPSAVDPLVTQHADAARRAQGTAAYTALREVWRRWDQTNPEQVEEALSSVARDGSTAAPVRAYASMLVAYARRRRGDLEGAKRRLAQLGFVKDWLVVGPFDNEAKASLYTPFGPEDDLASALTLGAGYEGKERSVSWRVMPDVFPYGWVDLGNALRPSEKVCGYVTTFVRAKPEGKDKRDAGERKASLWIGASGSFRAFWNAEEVLADPAYRALDADRWAAAVTVKPGWNRLTVKVCGDEEGPMAQVRLAGPDGAADPALEVKADPALGEAAAKSSVTRKKAAAPVARGVKVVAKGDPYAKGATDKPTSGSTVPTPFAGAMLGIAAATTEKKTSADVLEAAARYLALTGGEEKGQHTARDLATRAAETAPTTARLLFAADLAEDRNTRARWIEKARAGLKPGESDVDVTLAEAMHARGGSNFRDATPFFDRVLARDPRHVAALLGRTELYAEAGLRFSALATLEEAVRRVPTSIALLRALAHQYRGAGRTTDAEEIERRYANLRADDVAFLRGQAETATARRDLAAATRWLERLIALDPDSFGTIELAARSFRALGQTDRALALLEKRLVLAPEDVDAMRSLAEIHGEEGRREKQLEILRKILVLRPQAKDVREYVEHAQPPKIRKDEGFAWDKDKLLAASKEPRTPGLPKRTLRDLLVTTVYPNGLSSRFHQVAFQPLTEEAAASSRQYAFSYQSGREVVDVRGARVYRASGQVDEAIETGEGPADNPSIAMYTSSRTFYVQLPRLSAGDVVELRYRIDEVTPRNEYGDSFSETAYLGALEPVTSAEWVLLTPKTRKINLRLPTQPGFVMKESDDGELHVASISGEHLPAILPEPAMPPLAEVVANVGASTFATWDDVGKWYWGLAKDQFDADDEVRRKVAELTKGLTTDEEKVRAVYDFVVQRTRYVALEFGIEGFRPRRCALTLSRGWGDCKDKATVIVTMLRELGIPASFVLVRSAMRGDTQTEPPSYAMFDHAIAYVPKLDLFLDGTAEYTGMYELPPFVRGQPALVVNESGAKLVRVPELTADKTARTRRVELTLPEGTGGAQLDLRVETTGALAAEWRQRYHALATQKGRIVEDMGSEFGGLSVAERGIEVNDLENVETPVKVRVQGKALGLSRGTNGELSFTAMPSTGLVARYASLSNRRQDVKIGFSHTLDDEWTIKLPPGSVVKSAPEDRSLQTPFGRLDVKVEKSAGKLVVKAKLRMDQTRIKPAEYAAFKTFCADVDRALGERVVIGKPLAARNRVIA